MPQTVNLFPLTIFRESLAIDADQRAALVNAVLEMSNDATNKIPGTSWTGDVNGYESLHNDPRFATLFEKFAGPIQMYVETLGVDSDKIDVYYTRAWATVSRQDERIHAHDHKQSHISLVYYLQKPEGSSGIAFVNDYAPNEFAPNLFHEEMARFKVLRKSQELNAASVKLNPSEGDVIIFPSKAVHAIVPNRSAEPRISIAVDIVVTLRESDGLEYLLPNLRTWRCCNKA